MDGVNYCELKIYSKKPLHIHFKCSNCKDIIDIDDTYINLDYIKLNQKIEIERGLEIRDVNITLFGLCEKCRAKLHGITNQM
jgi:Fur family ferric uptake transcriptional regulator